MARGEVQAPEKKPAPPRPAPLPSAGRPAARPLREAGRRRKKPAWIWWGVGAAVLVLAVAIGWWAVSSRAGSDRGPRIDGDRLPSEGNTHVPIGTPLDYKEHPPASGNHYPIPAQPGIYPEGLLPGLWVHSLEHGYIVLAYRPPVSPEQLQQFRQLLDTLPKSKYGFVKLVVVPYKEMDHPYALLAWTWRLWLDQFDRQKVLGFYRAHVDRGPEDVP